MRLHKEFENKVCVFIGTKCIKKKGKTLYEDYYKAIYDDGKVYKLTIEAFNMK